MFANYETIETKPCWSPKHEREAIFSKFLFRILRMRMQLISPSSWFFRGKPAVRCYRPASVPRARRGNPHYRENTEGIPSIWRLTEWWLTVPHHKKEDGRRGDLQQIRSPLARLKNRIKFTKIVNMSNNSCIFAAQLNLNYDDTIRQGISLRTLLHRKMHRQKTSLPAGRCEELCETDYHFGWSSECWNIIYS